MVPNVPNVPSVPHEALIPRALPSGIVLLYSMQTLGVGY